MRSAVATDIEVWVRLGQVAEKYEKERASLNFSGEDCMLIGQVRLADPSQQDVLHATVSGYHTMASRTCHGGQ